MNALLRLAYALPGDSRLVNEARTNADEAADRIPVHRRDASVHGCQKELSNFHGEPARGGLFCLHGQQSTGRSAPRQQRSRPDAFAEEVAAQCYLLPRNLRSEQLRARSSLLQRPIHTRLSASFERPPAAESEVLR